MGMKRFEIFIISLKFIYKKLNSFTAFLLFLLLQSVKGQGM